MTDLPALLQRLGFSDYEACAYVALLQHGPVSGYEVAKVSGIPRDAVHQVLRRLEERGAVIRIDSVGAGHYAPLPVPEFLHHRYAEYRTTLDLARQALDELAPPAAPVCESNTCTSTAMLEQARALMESAVEELLVAICPAEGDDLVDTLARAEARGVELATLYWEPSPTRRFVVVADGREMLAGELRGDDQGVAVRTRQRLLVAIASWFIRHSTPWREYPLS